MAKKNSGDQYAVDGAIYKCQYGGAPCQIAVTSNQTIMAQGKAIVTDKDVTFKIATSPFVNCMQNPNKQAPICNYANGVWTPNTTEPQGKKNAITESSKMKCPVFAGEISCVFPGQTQGVSAGDFDVKMEALCNFPFALQVTFPVNQGKKTQPQPQSIYSVSATKLGEKKRYKFKDSMYVRPNELITLYAYKKGNVELKATEFVNWAVSKRRKGIVQKQQKNKNQKPISEEKIFLDKLVLYKMTCSPFNLKLKEPGVYYVEGGSNAMVEGYKKIDHKKTIEGGKNGIPKDVNCAIKVEVLEHNRILDVKMEGDPALNPKEKFKESVPLKQDNPNITYQSIQNSNKQADVLKSNYHFGANIPEKFKVNIKSKECYFTQGGGYASTTRDFGRPQQYTEVEVERYVHGFSDKIEFVVHTAVSLDKEEHFCILVNEYIHTDWILKYSVNTEYHFSLKVSCFYPNIDITILLTEGKMSMLPDLIPMKPKIGEAGVVDIKYLKIKQVNSIVFASVSLDKMGREEVPPMVRPETTIYLLVRPMNSYGKSNVLRYAEWKIEDKEIEIKKKDNKKSKGGEKQEEKKNVEEPIKKYNVVCRGESCELKLEKEGEVTITLSLAQCCDDYLSNYNNSQKEYTRTLKIQRNAAIGIEDPRSVLYAGIQYRFKVKFYYDDYLDKDGAYEYKLDGKVQKDTTDEISLNFGTGEVGSHCLSFVKEKYNFEVLKPIIETWQFVDKYHKKVSKVGFEEKIYLEINIPAWKDLRNSNELLQKVRLFLWDMGENALIEKLTDDARFDEKGTARIELMFTEDVVKLEGRKSIMIDASLMNIPNLKIENLEQKGLHWFKKERTPLILTSEMEMSGFFSGRSGKPQKSVMKYGDKIYIMLVTHNYMNKMDRISVELWENNYKGDADRLFEIFTNDDERFNSDEYGKVKVDLSDLFTDGSAHGENPNPRLFYFRVKLDENVVYQYPQTQDDVFNMKFKKKCESAPANDSQEVLSGDEEQPSVQNEEQNTDATQRPEINENRNANMPPHRQGGDGGRDANMPPHRQEENGDRNMEGSRRAMLNNEQREEVHQRPMQDAPQNTDAPQPTTAPTDSQTVPSTNAPQQTEQECDDSDTAVITQDDDVYTISKGDTSCDDNLKSKIRSYLWQLKVGKDKEVQRLNSTLAIIAPVIVGEKLTEGERNNDESQSACKNCHEEYELMAKRLKEVFDKVDENKLKIIAQAYCDYQYKLCMDSCWAKAVFFAAVYVESGPNLTIRKGEGFNYSVANLYYSGTFSRFKGNPSLCVEYGATNTSSCFKYTPSNKDIDTASFSKIDSVEEEGITSYIFKKDYIGKDKWDDKIHSHSCDSKKLANYVYSDRKDLGNNGGDDGWNFRGRGLCQITGRGAYTSIQNIMRSVGYNVDLENNPDLVVNDIRVATVSSMAFFVWKGLNMRNICDEYVDKNKIDFKKVGDDSDVKHGIDIVTRKMGNNPATSMKIKVGDENVSLLRNHRGKHLVFKDLMFEAFDLKNCQCKSVRTDETDIITYHIYSNRRIEKHIPLNITNKNIYRYVYHTEKASYLVAERKIIRDGFYFNENPVGVKDENRKNTELIYTYNKELKKIDGKDVYVKYRSNGVPEYVIVNAKDSSLKKGITNKLYKTDGRHTEVVRIDEVPNNGDEAIIDVVNQPGTLSFYVENEVFISYRVDLTQTERCYTNPTIMAIAIGILAEYGATKLAEVGKLYKDAYNDDKSDVRPVYSPHSYCRSQKEDNTTEPNFTFEGKFCRSGTGNVDKLGTGFPSQTHRNGMAFDFCYGKKSDDEKIIEIAKGYGFQNILCGTLPEYQRKGAKNDTNHNNHIHLGGLKYYKVNRDSKGDLIITKEGVISRTPILCGPLDDKPWGLANYVEIKEKEEGKNEK